MGIRTEKLLTWSILLATSALVGSIWVSVNNDYDDGYAAGGKAVCLRVTDGITARYHQGQCQVFYLEDWHPVHITRLETPHAPDP